MQKYTFGLLSLVALVGVLAVANLSEMKSYGLACGVPAVGAQPADWLPLPASGVDRAMVLCLALAAALSLFSASVAPPRRAFLTAWLLLVFAVLFGMLPVFARAVSPRESLLSWDFILVVGAVAACLVVSYRETPSDLKQLVRQLGEGAAVDRRRLVLLACAIGASAIVAAAFVLVVRTKVQLTRSEAITSLRHTLAATRVMSLMPPSGVQIVVFMDYQCPYCRITHGAIGEALRRLGSKAAAVEVRYKDFPLDASCNQMMSATLHKEACAAAYAVRVAERYGHRGSFEDWVFENQRSLNLELISARLATYSAHLETEFRRDRDTLRAAVQADIEHASRLEVTSTPSVFVNGLRFEGAMTADDLVTVVHAELEQDNERPRQR